MGPKSPYIEILENQACFKKQYFTNAAALSFEEKATIKKTENLN